MQEQTPETHSGTDAVPAIDRRLIRVPRSRNAMRRSMKHLEADANAAIKNGDFHIFQMRVKNQFKKYFGNNFRLFERVCGLAAADVLRRIIFTGGHPQKAWDDHKEYHRDYGEIIRDINREQVRASFKKLGLKKNHCFK